MKTIEVRKYLGKLSISIITVLLILGLGNIASTKSFASGIDNEYRKDLKWAALHGKSIQIDPGFPYYQNRSVESIVDEIELAGYNSVHYFVVNENDVNGRLIDAFRKRGIAVWALVLGNGTYSTASYPEEWPEWQMELLEPVNDGYVRLSPFSERYVEWKKEIIADLVTKYQFDGIEIAEPYFPEWNGIETGNYGDVGLLAQQAFYDKYKEDIPDFRDETSENYYLNNESLYNKWIEFRVDAVNDFLNELINGRNGVRDVRPNILVATWSLAIDAGEEPVNKLKEIQGLDAATMVERVKPDIHYFQTHWPDWSRADLPPDYMKDYQPFVDQLRNQHPEIPIGIQADIGSQYYMIKGQSWLDEFSDYAFNQGYQTWTAYEYHIGGYMYNTPPQPMRAVRINENQVDISFNKRINSDSVVQDSLFIRTNDGIDQLNDMEFTVDGNILSIQASNFPNNWFDLLIQGISDTPDLWLFKDYDANEVPKGSFITVKNIGSFDVGIKILSHLIESESISHPLQKKLFNSLKQVKHHLEKAHYKQAIHHLEKFQQHLQKSNRQSIDPNLKEKLLYLSKESVKLLRNYDK